MDKAELMALITRINTREEGFADSRETARWKVLREAETLDDPGLFSLLREIIVEHEGKARGKREVRDGAYFIYGRLMERAFSPEDGAFFLQRLTVETDKYVLHAMLTWVKDWGMKGHLLPEGTDVSPILALTVDDRRLVRQAALHALSACPGEGSRKACLFYLGREDERAYQYEIYYANIALQTIGKPEDIPVLERFLKSRRPDLKITARYAIQRIGEREKA